MWSDVDLKKGTIRIDKARVMGRDKDTTKTAVVRDVELCPRAIAVLKRQRALTGLKAEHVFGHDAGEPYHDLQIPWKRWVFTHKKLGIRYREPYQMRHTSVTWNLMIGKNLLWVAQNHGHSAAVMLKAYAKWLAGSTDTDVAKISAAMEFATSDSADHLICVS
jgi:integrase